MKLQSLRAELPTLFTLHGMAVLQPLLDALSHNPRFLIQEQISVVPVLLTVLLLSLLPLLPWGLAKLAEHFRWLRTARWICRLSLLVWISAATAVLTDWCATTAGLLRFGIPELLVLVVLLPLLMRLLLVLQSSASVRGLLSLTAFGVPFFLVMFLISPTLRPLISGVQRTERAVRAERPVPVFVLVFDGLNGMSLMNSRQQIDANRYPGFARLASMSTWYRNATANYPRTDRSLPSLLTSSLPDSSPAPIEAEYPENLLRTVHGTQQFEMTVFEPLTRLTPESLRTGDVPQPFSDQMLLLARTLAAVYLEMYLPGELPRPQGRIPRSWFGISEDRQYSRDQQRGLLIYPWDEQRSSQLEHFLRTVTPGDRPPFTFLHVALPHYPWQYLPDGMPYLLRQSIASPIYGLTEEQWTTDSWPVELAWQQNLLQVQHVDRIISRLLDRLEELKLLEQSLLIVTSDHGMSFVPGGSLRTPSLQNLADILPVPLFIRYPGQTEGQISDRNVELIDLVPTVSDVLGLPAMPHWEGSSLLSAEERLRKTLKGEFKTVLEPEFATRFEHLERMLTIFGEGGSPQDRLGNLNWRPQLVGRRLDEFTIVDSELRVRMQPVQVARKVRINSSYMELEAEIVPCLVRGKILQTAAVAPDTQVIELVLACEGVILSTTRTSSDPAQASIFSSLLPYQKFPEQPVELQLFELIDEGAGLQLGRIATSPLASVDLEQEFP